MRAAQRCTGAFGALLLVVGLSIGAGAPTPAVANETVPNPIVEGPIQGGLKPNPWNASTFALTTDDYDYREDEYFFSGTATDLSTGSTRPYKSRMLVRLPKDGKEFNGTILVDWVNVTNGQDWEYNWWPTAYDYLMREGFGVVAVSAQRIGVEHLRQWDTKRYATLFHTHDDFSFDIYAQAIKALRDGDRNATSALYPKAVDPALSYDVKHIVAGGVSQSASRLTSFINRGYNRGGLIDAYNIERGGGPFTDLSTFIFHLNEETGFAGTVRGPKPPDSDSYVFWEEAGTSHHPKEWWDYTWATMQRDLYAPGLPDPVNAACSVNRGTMGYSVRAMLHHTQRYLTTGKLPPSAPRIERTEDGGLVRDEDGHVVGGLRHPFIEVPVATNTANFSTRDCPNWGRYEPWTDEKITARYPTHGEYVDKVRRWANHEVSRGWLLRSDRDLAIEEAAAFTAPWDPSS